MSYCVPFADRTGWVLSSNSLSKMSQELKDREVSVLDLTESNPTRCGFHYPKEQLLQALQAEENLCYAPSAKGSLSAREAVCRYYADRRINVSPEQVFLTSCTSEAYGYLFRLLANSDEQILFPRPSYPLFQFLADLNDVELHLYNLVYSCQWAIDFNHLESVASSKTKAIVCVNPNNPTGSYVSPLELEKLNEICLKRHYALISDEVFWDYCLDKNASRASVIGNDQVLSFSLGGISKALGLPQMKLSWIIISGPGAVVEQAKERLEVISDTYLSVNCLSQNAFPRWGDFAGSIQQEISARIQSNYALLAKKIDSLSGTGCSLLRAQGGWYAVLKLPKEISEENFALKLLEEDHLLVYPGYFFDFLDETHIVLSLLPVKDVFEDGVSCLLNKFRLIHNG